MGVWEWESDNVRYICWVTVIDGLYDDTFEDNRPVDFESQENKVMHVDTIEECRYVTIKNAYDDINAVI